MTATPLDRDQHEVRLRRWPSFGSAGRYVILLAYCLIALVPIALIVLNSFKTRTALFENPTSLPLGGDFSLDGYKTVLAGHFLRALANSVVVTTSTVALVLVVGSMAAFAFATYVFRGRQALSFYMLVGILLPTTLGSVITLQLISSLGLINNLFGLILVYIAQSLPLAILVLGEFLRDVPSEIIDAARVDGASEFRIYRLTLPLIWPALTAVAVLTMIPVWNDLWWPLILAPSRDTQTLILNTQQFVGQYRTDWSALLSALTMAMAPVLLIYALFSRQLVRGLMSGAVK
jgi:raffinose/stachyose/melibiose transport system permease protein